MTDPMIRAEEYMTTKGYGTDKKQVQTLSVAATLPIPVTPGSKQGFDPMSTATQHLEASPKPSYGPHKASERYLDDEDDEQVAQCYSVLAKPAYVTTVDELLFSIERLRTHLRKKYYAG